MVIYQLEVYTGPMTNGSTAANVYVNVCSDDGDTGCRALKKSLNNAVKFAAGQV